MPATLLALLVGATLAPSAFAAPWLDAQLPGRSGLVYLLGVSCPSPSFCVAVGTDNTIASSTNPAGGSWNVVNAGDGASPYIPDTAPHISGRQIQAVSCPSPTLCVAVTNQGSIYSSTDPTGPASAWKVISIDGKGRNTHLFGVSCPTVSLCVAVSGKREDEGKIFSTTDPTGDAPAWKAVELGEPFQFRAVSCSSPSLCVAVAEDGRIVTSTEPRGDASAWQVVGAPASGGALRAVSCVESLLCVSGNQGGNMLSSTDPTAGLGSWKVVNGGGSVQITGASCPSTSECLAVDNNGDILTATDPAAGEWAFGNLLPFKPAPNPIVGEGNALFGASCPSRSLCTVVGTLGQIFTNTDPFAAESTPTNSAPAPARRVKRPRVKIATVRMPFGNQLRKGTARVMIRFFSRAKVRRFLCKFDRRPFRRCRSPKRYPIGVGKHLFSVRAIGVTGLRGPVAREAIVVPPFCDFTNPRPGICTDARR